MKSESRQRRHKRIAKKIKGITLRPRFVVFRSHKHIYAQLIDDSQGKTIVGCSTLSKEFKQKNIKSNDREAALALGMIFARMAKSKGIDSISFDRAGYRYHGRVKSLAEGAKKGGLKF